MCPGGFTGQVGGCLLAQPMVVMRECGPRTARYFYSVKKRQKSRILCETFHVFHIGD